MRVGVNLKRGQRMLRAGRLVVAVNRCTRSTPFLDGARMHVERHTKCGEPLESFDAGGVRIRLSRAGGPGHAMVPTLDVAWRGARIPHPNRWPLTRTGRSSRRAWKASLAERRTGRACDGAQAAPNPSAMAGR